MRLADESVVCRQTEPLYFDYVRFAAKKMAPRPTAEIGNASRGQGSRRLRKALLGSLNGKDQHPAACPRWCLEPVPRRDNARGFFAGWHVPGAANGVVWWSTTPFVPQGVPPYAMVSEVVLTLVAAGKQIDHFHHGTFRPAKACTAPS